MSALYRLPLVFTPEPEGGYTVTSPLLPELVTCGHDLADALVQVEDALAAVLEFYEELGWTVPAGLRQEMNGQAFAFAFDFVVAVR